MEIIITAPLEAVSFSKVASLIKKYFEGRGYRCYMVNSSNIIIPLRKVDVVIAVDTIFRHSMRRVLNSRRLGEIGVFSCDVEGIPILTEAEVEKLTSSYIIIPSSNHTVRMIEKAGINTKHLLPRAIDIDEYRKVDENKVEQFKKKYGDYFLFVGADMRNTLSRKGFDIMLNAWKLFNEKVKKCNLVMVTNHNNVNSRNIHKINFGSLSEEELKALYKGSIALVFPSRCEGFGLPPLEAMALRVPLIYSNAPAHNEFSVGVKVDPIYIYYYKTWFDIDFIMHDVSASDLCSKMLDVYVDGYDNVLLQKAYDVALQYDYEKVYQKLEHIINDYATMEK